MVWFNKGGGVPFRILIPMDTACFHTLITIVCKPIVSLVVIIILYDCKLLVFSVTGANSKLLLKTIRNSITNDM